LSYFDLIVPCGISDCRATSLQKLLQRPMTPAEVLPHLLTEFGRAFSLDMHPVRQDELEKWLSLEQASRIAVTPAAD
jgi:lipoate-protein ligase B